MYRITESQINTLAYIINNLTVTGPVQGGLLNNAGGILESIRGQKIETIRSKGKEGSCGNQ